MVNKIHSQQKIVNGLHGIASFEYADEATRLAAGPFHDYDLYKVASQLDDGSLWILKSVSPIEWDSLGGVIDPGTDGQVYVTDLGIATWELINDFNIDPNADIEVSKLAGSIVDGYF